MVFFSFPLGRGWRKIPCLFLSGYPVCLSATLRCNIRDPEKIIIAISNLVDNALAFTGQNGQVVLNAEKLPGFAKISVIDNGVGIPAKDLERVFDRFFQVESHYTRRHGGLGVGLSVAKVMIELHGGQIWVDSVEGKGSNFSFILPTQEASVFHS